MSSLGKGGTGASSSKDGRPIPTPTSSSVETMGIEPTTSCVQTTGWTVHEHPEPS